MSNLVYEENDSWENGFTYAVFKDNECTRKLNDNVPESSDQNTDMYSEMNPSAEVKPSLKPVEIAPASKPVAEMKPVAEIATVTAPVPKPVAEVKPVAEIATVTAPAPVPVAELKPVSEVATVTAHVPVAELKPVATAPTLLQEGIKITAEKKEPFVNTVNEEKDSQNVLFITILVLMGVGYYLCSKK